MLHGLKFLCPSSLASRREFIVEVNYTRSCKASLLLEDFITPRGTMQLCNVEVRNYLISVRANLISNYPLINSRP